ncbi:MAG: hypothetical protein CL946_10205 [Ectothiorhodospiraceae bacterium]|nr:hypothetical protein [Ectothiorhodospiraceae bacterium]
MSKPSFNERLRYRIDQFFQSGFTLQLVIASSMIVAVMALFYGFAEVFQIDVGPDFASDGSDRFWPSVRFWWVVTHLLETYWIEASIVEQLTATILTLFNFLVFAAIIGLVGSKIQSRLESMRRGTSRAIEFNHYVIIGWSEKVLPIVRELHEGLERKRTAIAILSEHPVDEIEQYLRKKLGRLRKLRLVIRQGNATDPRDLDIVSIGTCKSIIILRPNGASDYGDALVIKTIMAVEHAVTTAERSGERRLPNVIAELERDETLPLAYAAANNMPLSIVQPSDYLSKIILQTARQTGLVQIYDELLEHRGSEIHALAAEKLTGIDGMRWEEFVFSFDYVIPIGLQRDGVLYLNPQRTEETKTVRSSDTIFFVAEDSNAIRERGERREYKEVPATQALTASSQPIVHSFMIIGYNEKVKPFLEECNRYAHSVAQRFSITLVSPSASVNAVQSSDYSSLDIDLVHQDYIVPAVLEKLNPGAYQAVIVLGEQEHGAEWGDADTRAIMTLLLLRNLRQKAADAGKPFPKEHQIVGEIIYSTNKELARSTGTVNDVIISLSLISKMIAQICRDPRIEPVLKDLFDESGDEIYLKPLSAFTDADSIEFGELLAICLARGETPIGLDLADPSDPDDTRIVLNPNKSEWIAVTANTRVIVISENEE